MQPFQQIPKNKVRAVFSDIDDTLTEHSLLRPEVVQALYRLKEKGFWFVFVSGRPAGWADCLMRIFPADAMVFENGAGYMIRKNEKIETVSLAAGQSLTAQRSTLETLFQEIKKKIPTVKLATDQAYRLFDYAVDFAEEPPRLQENDIQWILDFLGNQKNITAKLSSIHINYWVGSHTKVTAIKHLLDTVGKEKGIEKDSVIYTGDSPNDEPLFDFFPLSVGVANVQPYLPKMKTPPKYITTKKAGSGFEELVSWLLIS